MKQLPVKVIRCKIHGAPPLVLQGGQPHGFHWEIQTAPIAARFNSHLRLTIYGSAPWSNLRVSPYWFLATWLTRLESSLSVCVSGFLCDFQVLQGCCWLLE